MGFGDPHRLKVSCGAQRVWFRERRDDDAVDERSQINEAVNAFGLARRVDWARMKTVVEVDMPIAGLVRIDQPQHRSHFLLIGVFQLLRRHVDH